MKQLKNNTESGKLVLSDREAAELMSRLGLMHEGGRALSLLLLPILATLLFWNYINHVELLLWAIAECIAVYDRHSVAAKYLKLSPPITEAKQWMLRFILNVFASGLLWGYAGFFFFVENSVAHQIFIYTWIATFAGSALFVASFLPPRFYLTYAIPAYGLSAARIMMEGGLEYQVLATLMLLNILFLYMVVTQAHLIQVNAVRLKFKNMDLVDELKQQKEIAEQANLAKSKFLAAASHDLRQPLHALGLFAAALKERIKFPEVRSLVDNINCSVTALEGLFNALLDISRLDAGIIQPKMQHFRIKDLMSRLSTEFTGQAKNKNLSIQFEGPEEVIYSDPVLLETIVRNLVCNAIRFSTNGEVKVRWVSDRVNVKIDVIDTGIGIPSEELEHIFQEFVQLNNPERDRTKGLGLGLAIVRRLCALMNCKISVQSRTGDGSTFSLIVPVGDMALIPKVDEMLLLQSENEPSMRVLVIDDESSVREAMTKLLEIWGHEVQAVGSISEAMQVTEGAPDAVIADYRLRRDETGIEAIKKIQQKWGDIPSLIVTGDTAPDRLQEAQASGFAFMHKPVNSAKLRAFLRTAYRLKYQSS